MNSKRKGSGGERELVEYFTSHGYESSRNNQMYIGGKNNPDVEIPGIHAECKRCESFRLYPSLEQAIQDAHHTMIPAVFHRKNREPWIVVMRLDDWIELYKTWRPPEWNSERTPKQDIFSPLMRARGTNRD